MGFQESDPVIKKLSDADHVSLVTLVLGKKLTDTTLVSLGAFEHQNDISLSKDVCYLLIVTLLNFNSISHLIIPDNLPIMLKLYGIKNQWINETIYQCYLIIISSLRKC